MPSLGNKPVIVILGLIASIIAIVAFFSGKESIEEFISTPTPIVVNVIVQTMDASTGPSQIIVVTATDSPISAAQPASPTDRLESQFNSNDPEGFLMWYFHEVWNSRDYQYLWSYLSDDFKDRLNLSYADYEDNWTAIGSIDEPIEINYEGKEGTLLKYRVQYTTYSQKGNYPDRRKDLYRLSFNTNKDHWEFK